MTRRLQFVSLQQARAWVKSNPGVLDVLLADALKFEGIAAVEFWPGCACPSFIAGFAADGRMLVCFPIRSSVTPPATQRLPGNRTGADHLLPLH